MDSNKTKIDFYNDRIDDVSTDLEMLSKLKTDSSLFVKVSSIASVGVIPTVSAATYALSNFSIAEVSVAAIIASCCAASGIYITKSCIDSKNKEIDFKIHDDLREIDRLSKKVAILENDSDNTIATTMVENRGKLYNRTRQ